jgi:hypothetical protein
MTLTGDSAEAFAEFNKERERSLKRLICRAQAFSVIDAQPWDARIERGRRF